MKPLAGQRRNLGSGIGERVQRVRRRFRGAEPGWGRGCEVRRELRCRELDRSLDAEAVVEPDYVRSVCVLGQVTGSKISAQGLLVLTQIPV